MTKITVTPWMLTEIPFEVEFRHDRDNKGWLDYPRMLIGEYEEEVRKWGLEEVLYKEYQRMRWEDPFLASEREELNRIQYHKPVAHIGYPVSLDPIRNMMILGYPLGPKELDEEGVKKAIADFLNLALHEQGLSSESERSSLYAFAREYGLWVPFEPLSHDSKIDAELRMGAIQDEWQKLYDKFNLYFLDTPQAELEGPMPDALTSSVYAPYRDHQELERSQYSGKWLWWPELMKVWHEAASKINVELQHEIADEAVVTLLGVLRSSCTISSQKSRRGGRLTQIEKVVQPLMGADATVVLIAHFDEKIIELDEEYQWAMAQAVLNEYREIDKKIAIAEKQARGEGNPVQPRIRKSRTFEISQNQLDALSNASRALKTIQVKGIHRSTIEALREQLGMMTGERIRLDETEQNANARISWREEGEKERARLSDIKSAVEQAFSKMELTHPEYVEFLTLKFVQQKSDEQLGEMRPEFHLVKSKLYEVQSEALRIFAESCHLSSLTVTEKLKGKRGRKKAEITKDGN